MKRNKTTQTASKAKTLVLQNTVKERSPHRHICGNTRQGPAKSGFTWKPRQD